MGSSDREVGPTGCSSKSAGRPSSSQVGENGPVSHAVPETWMENRMLALTTPRRVKKLVRNLEHRGFSLETNEPRSLLFGNDFMVLRSSGTKVTILFDQGMWEVWVGGPGLAREPMSLWKAHIENTESRIEIQDIEWQCDYLERHLDEIEAALAPQVTGKTRESLSRRRREANSRG
jgi:hypothetical protein